MARLDPSAARRVDAAADEAVVKGGLRSLEVLLTTIVSFSRDTTLPRRALLRALLHEHFEALQKAGGALPDIATYLAAFPDDAEQAVVREVLAEQLPTLRVELGREIGRGGMGVIFEGRQTAVGGRRVAVKMLEVGLANQAALWNRLREEVDILAQLPATNVVQVHDVGLIDGHLAVVMELAEQNLQERTGGLPMDEREAAQLVRKLAVAVQKAHDHPRKLIHQDLKPSNVLIMPDGEAKVADFGLFHSARGNAVPTPGRVVGTPGWLAPEQARGEPPTFATDVWGLGAILYFLLCGAPPFPPRREEIDAVLLSPVSDVAERRSAAGGEPLDPRLAAIAAKCLQKVAAQRYPRPIKLAEELQRYLNAEPVHAPMRVNAKKSSSKWILAACTAVACIAVAIPAAQWAFSGKFEDTSKQTPPVTQPSAEPAVKPADDGTHVPATAPAEMASKPQVEPPSTQPPPATGSAETRSANVVDSSAKPNDPGTPTSKTSEPPTPASLPVPKAGQSTQPAETKLPRATQAPVKVENHFFVRDFPKGPVDSEFDLPVDDFARALMADSVRSNVDADPNAKCHETWRFQNIPDRPESRVTFTRTLVVRYAGGSGPHETTLDQRYGECTQKSLSQFFKAGRNHFITEASFGSLKDRQKTLADGVDGRERRGKLLWKGTTKNFYEMAGNENNDLVIWGLVPKHD